MAMFHPVPERLQPLEPVFDGIPGNQRGIDRADRGAYNPIGFDPCFVQRLIDARLIGTQRAAALEDEDNLSKFFDLGILILIAMRHSFHVDGGFTRYQAGMTFEGQIVPKPVRADEQTVAKPGKKPDMCNAPDDPGGEARDLDASEIPRPRACGRWSRDYR